jgi:exonuclease III
MYSYFDIRKGRVRASRRYDHLFASSALTPQAVHYDDAPRQAGLSDHAPLVVAFRVG